MKKEEILEELKKFLKTNSQWDQEINEDIKNANIFRDGGNQYEGATQSRTKKRLINNEAKKVINRIVNPVRLNPYKTEITAKRDDALNEAEKSQMDAVARVLQSRLDRIFNTPEGQESSEVSLYNSSTSGYGWMGADIGYKDEYSLDQAVTPMTINDSTTIIGEVLSTDVVGRDMNGLVIQNYISKDYAEEKYGDDVSFGDYDSLVFGKWRPKTDDSIPEVIFYHRKPKDVKRTFLLDGSFSDDYQGPESNVKGVRTIEDFSVFVSKIVGVTVVETVELDCQYIPIIPVYGEECYDEAIIKKSGVIHDVKDLQKAVNYTFSSITELLSTAPKASIVADVKSIGQFMKIYKSLGNEIPAFLPWDSSKGGARPERMQTGADIGSWMQALEKFQNDIRLTVGGNNSFGLTEGANQSGLSTHLRQQAGDIGTAHYTQNLEQSIIQLNHVGLKLDIDIAPTEVIEWEEGEQIQRAEINLKTDIRLSDFEIRTVQGPASESKRKETLSLYSDMQQRNPQEFDKYIDLYLESINTPTSLKMAKRAAKDVRAKYPNLVEEEGVQSLDKQEDRESKERMNTEDNMIKLATKEMEMQGEKEQEVIKAKAGITEELIKQEGSAQEFPSVEVVKLDQTPVEGIVEGESEP
jgi:hypothetical protein